MAIKVVHKPSKVVFIHYALIFRVVHGMLVRIGIAMYPSASTDELIVLANAPHLQVLLPPPKALSSYILGCSRIHQEAWWPRSIGSSQEAIKASGKCLAVLQKIDSRLEETEVADSGRAVYGRGGDGGTEEALLQKVFHRWFQTPLYVGFGRRW